MDVWSIGCILYTLLVGKPPFETQTLKDTYTRIKKNEYHIPSRIGPLARNLIQRLLQHEPARRPSVGEILKDDFMTMGFLPTRLPVSCLTMAPRFDTKMNASLIARRTPLTEVNSQPGTGVPTLERKDSNRDGGGAPSDCYLSELHKQLGQLVASKPGDRGGALGEDECEDPKSQPMTWVSKWVDYSDKYGFGYSLNDDSIGVVFNDLTKLLLLADGANIHYIDYEQSEHYYTLNEFPATVEKKVLQFAECWIAHHIETSGEAPELLPQLHEGALVEGRSQHGGIFWKKCEEKKFMKHSMQVREEDALSRIPALKTWFRTSRAVVCDSMLHDFYLHSCSGLPA